MYQPMLFIHWKQARLLLIPFIIAAFGLPLLVVQGLGGDPGQTLDGLGPYAMLTDFSVFLPVFPFLAFTTGAFLALTAWAWDHDRGHVYSLSLPVARWEYAMLKMGAGLALGLIPAAALWVGAHLAAASVTLPAGLNAYPNELALRFFLALLTSYAVLFALAAGTVRTALIVITAIAAFFFLVSFVNEALALFVPYFRDVNFVAAVGEWLVRAGGPLEVFTGNWALIDV